MSSISTPAPRVNATLRLLGAAAHMVVVGFVGIAVFTVLITLLGVGVGLVPVLGIGALLLIGFVYLLFATAFTETARVEGLYGFGMPMLKPRRSPKPGFVGFLHTVWLQFIDAGMWRAVAHFAIVTVLGWVAFAAVAAIGTGIAAAFAPLYASGGTVYILGFPVGGPLAPVFGVAAVLLALALLFGLALLHGALSRVLIAPIREAQLAAAARDASAQRQDAIRASDVERTRIERDLHDGVQPRLVSVGMTLGLAQQKIDAEPEKAKELLAEAHTSTKAAITELRQLARGIHASVLDDRGLDAALSAVASRSHIPVALDVRMPGRVGRDAEAAVYFAIAESLTNAAKHSRATEARVTVRTRPESGTLWARVEDNGVGGARVLPGGGLDGIQNRITALGGTCRLDSPAGGPTSLEVNVPCAS
ncbi:two-component sensor histidine kinase [Microbacterium nanhaiense]|uniref:histidine kinase n=1 Tax=Microbacterium nanhaiense TaxID=1301026 RepID=A0ABQ2N448_9MICO|nr:histidine kinase [Microbacterium nanhaiense]GGO66069.1 two-component sensor histidine kinase [Microbacterium nanhaiense]